MTTDGNAPMTTDGNAPMTAAARTNAAAPLGGRPPLGATRGLPSGEAPAASGERGNILVLGTAMWLAAVVALAVVVNVTSLYIQRRELMAAADSIALEAAQEVDENAYYGGAGENGSGPSGAASPGVSAFSSRLYGQSQMYGQDGRRVRSRAERLAGAGIRVGEPTGVRGGSVVVTLETEARLPLSIDGFGPRFVRIGATSSAKLRAIDAP